MKYGRRALGIASAAAVMIGVACYGPTEVRIEISTDRPCVAPPSAAEPGSSAVRTAVAVGGSALDTAQVTEVSSCLEHPGADTEIGSLVIVPSGDRDARVNVQVTMTTNGRPTSDCVPSEDADKKQVLPDFCIVARRSFAFISHTSRVLPIKLYDACRGVGCAAEQTCGAGGGCRSSDVDVEPEPGEKCVGSCDDAAAPLPDANVLPDGAVPSCTGANDDHVVATTGSVSEHLVGNTTRLFWDGPVMIGGANVVEVQSVAKQGGAIETIPLQGVTSASITALAADDTTLWIATATDLVRYDLLTKKFVVQSLPGIRSIAIDRSVNTAPSTYFVTPHTANGEGVLYVSDGAIVSSGTLASVVGGTLGGEHVAVGGSYVSVLDGFAGTLYRYQLPFSAGGPGAGGATMIGAAAHSITTYGSTFYYVEMNKDAAQGDLRVVSAPPVVTITTLRTVAHPGRIAADALFVYYLDHGVSGGKPSPGAVRRVVSTPGPISPDLTPPIPPVAEGFDDVNGLVVDDCVYFFGSASAQPGGPKLLVYPKVPVGKL